MVEFKQKSSAGSSSKPKQTKNKPTKPRAVQPSRNKPASKQFTNPITTLRNGFNGLKQLHWNRPRVALVPLLIVISCLQIVTTVTPHWLQLHDVHYQGIWRVCTQTKDGIRCFRYDFQPEYFKTIQAMMVVAIVMYLISLTYITYMLKIKKAPAFILTATISIAGTLAIGSLGWFTDANLQTVTLSAMKFGWSYYIGWVTVFLTLISAAISLWDERYRATVVN